MFIEHISDTHGKMFSCQRRNSILIHSGDMFPNLMNGYLEDEIIFQKEWVIKNISLFPKEFLYTLGNHDFIDPFELEEIFNSNGIKAICLHDKVVSYYGMKFYGFPYIPIIQGRWNYECFIDDMQKHVNKLIEHLNEIDVIVAHAPLYGFLDISYTHGCAGTMAMNVGNSVLLNALNYNDNKVKYYLCGHIHPENFGQSSIAMFNNMLISNAATSRNFIQI